MRIIKHIPKKSILFILIFFIISSFTVAYKQGPNVTDISDPNSYVHQKITQEAEKAWPLIPYEIKSHLTNNLGADPNDEISYENQNTCKNIENANYDLGDDIITGSGEEDNARTTCQAIFGNHFWQVDTVNSGNYDDGLNTPIAQDSSYRRALEFWRYYVIPNYLRGSTNESYYWLGRVAHLLEDAAQPSHVHNDAHGGHWYSGGESILETYTGENVDSYLGNNLQLYRYDSLIDGFNWSTVEPRRLPDKMFLEFFRLFWYTAQKTQYWASDGSDGNILYKKIDEDNIYWSCSGTDSTNLWADFNYTSGRFCESG